MIKYHALPAVKVKAAKGFGVASRKSEPQLSKLTQYLKAHLKTP